MVVTWSELHKNTSMVELTCLNAFVGTSTYVVCATLKSMVSEVMGEKLIYD